MFKFGFSEEGTANSRKTLIATNEEVWLESKEIIPDESILSKVCDYNSICNFKCKSHMYIKHLSNEVILKHMKENSQNSIVLAEENHSDLITGVYEGGLKIWECTKDLLDFIYIEQIDLNTKNVLDLGCGTGIIGIYSLLSGAHVHFQDYNSDVITSVTIPNVLLNLNNLETILNTSKFYSGDWQSFVNVLGSNNRKFDFILTSETIYNANNYSKLHSVFINCLKKTGVIYVAAKTYYFGVGGGLRSFEDFIRKMGFLDYQSCWICSSGINREILKLTWK